MSLLEQLSPASYKGVPFLVTSGSVSGGRKTVKHTYPNKDTQVIEDIGLKPREYSMQIVITGKNYLQSRDDLIRVFDQGGPGTLVHPFYGRIENMVAISYTLTENMSSLGDGRISVIFEPTLDTGIPQANISNLNNISSNNDALGASIASDVGQEFGVTESFIGNFTAGADLLDFVVSEFEENTRFLQASADQIDEFTNQINAFSRGVFSLINAPSELADSLNNLFISVNNLYPTVDTTASILSGFFDFSGGLRTAGITAGQIERDINTEVIEQAVQNLALGYAYLNTVQIEFETTDGIDAAAQALEDQYQKNVDARGLSNETKSALADLRLSVQSFFEDQKLNVRQVIEIYTPVTSARLLSFQYYGDSGDGEALATLNGIVQDVSFLSGDIKVLTA